jgi:hypothetical protein
LRASLLLAGAALVGCGGAGGAGTVDALVAWPDEDRWPDPFRRASAEVQEAYRFAVANPDVLRWMPCFCGCAGQGHAANLDCHVAEFRPDGSVLLDAMGFG